MKALNNFFLRLAGLTLITIIGCKEDEVSPPRSDFNSPEEYIENPSVKTAVNESNIPIYGGDNPPALAGDYDAFGEIVDTSPSISVLIGQDINSLITLYNQTISGKISIKEKVGEITVWGSGGYITGTSGSFTIWQESLQSGSKAGLPDDITINVALLLSGIKLEKGDLSVIGISIITDVETDNPDYDVDEIMDSWWMVKGDYYLK